MRVMGGDLTAAGVEQAAAVGRDAAARLAGLSTSTVRTLHAIGAGNQACISRLRATSQPRPARRVAPMEIGNVASCGGEYEPSKCMNKGYKPDPPPPATYLIKLKLHHDSSRLHAMLASQATVTQALVTQAPAPAAPPAGTDTTNGMTYGIEYDNDGAAFMVGRKALMMTDGMVLSAFGGRQAFPGEADVIMDSGCTTSGCVPSSHGLINLRSPEIDGLTVGNAEWCPTESRIGCSITQGTHDTRRTRHANPCTLWCGVES